jgi:Immunoglobulin I-set domain
MKTKVFRMVFRFHRFAWLLCVLLPVLAAPRIFAQECFVHAEMSYFEADGYVGSYCAGGIGTVWLQYGPTTNYGTILQITDFSSTYNNFPAFTYFFVPYISGQSYFAELWHYRAAIWCCNETNYTADATFVTDGNLVFVQQPQSQTVAAGGSATFTATALGIATVVFQWMTNGVPIPGATNANYNNGQSSVSYTFTNAQPADNGLAFSVTMSAYDGGGTSSNAVLTVLPPPPSPTLLGVLRGTNIVLTWLTNAGPGFVLETSDGSGPNSWVTVPNTPTTNSARVEVTLPATDAIRFFRLDLSY